MQLRVVKARRAVSNLGKETAHCESGVVFDEHLGVNYFLALLESVVLDLALLIEGVEVGKVAEIELVDHLEEEVTSLAKKQRAFG